MPENAADHPEAGDHDGKDQEKERDLEEDDAGELAAAADRDDARDEREFEALERIRGHAGDGLRFGQHAVRIPAGGLDDVADLPWGVTMKSLSL